MNYSRAEQAARIENLHFAEVNASDCLRKLRIRNYMPGQVTYTLGDYPEKISSAPTDYDVELIRDLARRGVELIQVHEDWNDAMEYHGGNKYSSLDPKGLHAFVDLCHDNGIKIIPYISSGYVNHNSLLYRESFSNTAFTYDGVILHYRKGSADSADWREFIIPTTLSVIDEYGFDGVYNDWGYDGLNAEIRRKKEAFNRHDMPYDPAVEDLLCLIYEEIHRRGGVYKLHDDSTHGVYHEKLYDYLWIGEGERDAKKMLLYRDAPPYVVPCPDKGWLPKDNPRYYFALTIPFIQFPILTHGRPYSGMGMIQPHVAYDTTRSNFGKRMAISEYCRSHPNGPYIYSHWSGMPDDPEEINYWSDMLALYRPMVAEGSVVHSDIRHSPMFREELPEDVIASLFSNEKRYLVISNIGDREARIQLRESWRDRESGETVQEAVIGAKDILFLEKLPE